MLTDDKQLDRVFLINYYQDKVNDTAKIFETFIAEVPADIKQINNLLTCNNYAEALKKLHKTIPALLCIGLPQLAVKLQTVEVYLHFSNYSTAKLLMYAFDKELKEYMPAIAAEYVRVKAC